MTKLKFAPPPVKYQQPKPDENPESFVQGAPPSARTKSLGEALVASGVTDVIEVDTAFVDLNPLHARDMAYANVRKLADAIEKVGQTMPALAWQEDERYILVYGARRRAACALLDIPLKLRLVAKPSNELLAQLMFSENAAREDYSPLEQAREMSRYLSAGGFRTVKEMCAKIGESEPTASRLLSLLELPDPILALFKDPSWLKVVTGSSLAKACKNPELLSKLLSTAASIAAEESHVDPTPRLLESISSKESYLQVKINGRVVGQYKGAVNQPGAFAVTLNKHASPELKAKIVELLRSGG